MSLVAPLAHDSSLSRHLLAVKTDPPFTPTTPKPGDLGNGLPHWGKLMSKPVEVAEGVMARSVGDAEATTNVATRTTTAMTTAVEDFVKNARTRHKSMK